MCAAVVGALVVPAVLPERRPSRLEAQAPPPASTAMQTPLVQSSTPPPSTPLPATCQVTGDVVTCHWTTTADIRVRAMIGRAM